MQMLRLLVVLLTIHALPALSLWDCGDPTPTEQHILETINRARADPVADSGFIPLAPSPPLAMNRLLLQIARAHSQDMWTFGYRGHLSLSGKSPSQRMTEAGYAFSGATGENIADSFNATASQLGDELMRDIAFPARTHRRNLLDIDVDYREVGIGYYHNDNLNSLSNRDYLTQDFATSANGPFLVGVVYADSNSNGFCDLGEGLSGVLVTPSSGTHGALTGQAGGYAFPVALSGTLTVTFTGGGLAGKVTKTGVTLGGVNLKLDAKASEAVSGGSAPATPLSPAAVSSTTSATPTLSGTTVANATVTIFDNLRAIGVATADGGGAWTWTPGSPLAGGVHSLTWKASNDNGTSGASPAVVVTVSSGGSTGSSLDAEDGGGGCGAGTPGIGVLILFLLLGLRPFRRRDA
jgi:uncharacterized protein YkwD